MTHGRPFKIYSVICLVNGKRLISGSDLPHKHLDNPVWYKRGEWGVTYGTLWRTDTAIKRHLHHLCHDWERLWEAGYPDGPSEFEGTWTDPIGKPDWDRLNCLAVEETFVSDYKVSEILAKDFMGVLEDA